MFLGNKTKKELISLAQSLGIKVKPRMKKSEIIDVIWEKKYGSGYLPKDFEDSLCYLSYHANPLVKVISTLWMTYGGEGLIEAIHIVSECYASLASDSRKGAATKTIESTLRGLRDSLEKMREWREIDQYLRESKALKFWLVFKSAERVETHLLEYDDRPPSVGEESAMSIPIPRVAEEKIREWSRIRWKAEIGQPINFVDSDLDALRLSLSEWVREMSEESEE